MIDIAIYQEMGGAVGALARRAEAVYQELDEGARETTRQLLLRLVSVGDGDSDEITRRRAFREELLGLGDERVSGVLDSLGAHRLLAFDRDAVSRAPTVEIAHEALFSEWGRLSSWVTDCRDDVRRHRRLAAAAEDWRREGQAPDYLLRGVRLDESNAAAEDGAVMLTPSERAFLDASAAHRDDERAAERAQREREDRLRRKGRRRTVLLIGGAVALAVVTLAAVSTALQRRESDRLAALRKDAGRLAAASVDAVDADPQLGMLLALQSLATSARAGEPARSDSEDALQWGIQAAGLTYPVSDAAVAVHQGPHGPTGVFALPLVDLVGLARSHLTGGFTPDECATYKIRPCPSATWGLPTPASTGPAALPAEPPPLQAASSERPLAGTTITILDPLWSQPSTQGSVDAETVELQRFSAETSIGVDVARVGVPLTLTALPNGARPDVLIWPYPGTLNDLASQGRLIDLSTYLDRSALRKQVGDYFVDQATTGSSLSWVPISFSRKGLVWYPKRQFEQAGYQVPRTWDELIALSQHMVADGRTPWCFGLEGTQTLAGSAATDWLEALVMRAGGVDAYDRWTTHALPFDSPIVRRAGEMFGQVAFGNGFVLGGPVNQRHGSEVSFPLYDQPPGCWMFLGTDGDASGLPPRARDLVRTSMSSRCRQSMRAHGLSPSREASSPPP